MAVVDYTKRSVSLNNLGAVRSVHPIAPDFSGQAEAARSKAAYHGAGARLGGIIAGTGAVIGKAAIDLSALLTQREDDRILAKAAGMVMSMHDQTMQNPERDDNGRPIGLLNRMGEDCRMLPEEGHQKLNESLKAVSEELDLSDRQVEMLQQKLSPYAFSCRGRLMQRRNAELVRVQEAEAKALWTKDLQTIADGNNTEDMYRSAVQDFDHYLDVVGSTGQDRLNQHDTFVRSMFKSEILSTLKGFQTEAEFDDAIKAAEENPKSLFMGNKVLMDEMGGEVGEETHREMVKAIREERDRFVSRRDHERQQLAGEARTSAVRTELESMDANLSEKDWVDFYRNLGGNPILREYAPETALGYMKHADRLDEIRKNREEQDAAKKAWEDAQRRKAEVDATEERLSLRLTNLTAHELNGDRELIGGQLAAEQASIWRDYQAALRSGKLGEGFANSFLNRIRNRLTDEERTAMREFYAACGYRGEIQNDGGVSEAAKKAVQYQNFQQPVDEREVQSGDQGWRRLTSKQLFELGETFLGELRSKGPDAYRPEIMRAVIGEIKTRRMAEDFNRNRDEAARMMMNAMRNANAQQQTEETNDGE